MEYKIELTVEQENWLNNLKETIKSENGYVRYDWKENYELYLKIGVGYVCEDGKENIYENDFLSVSKLKDENEVKNWLHSLNWQGDRKGATGPWKEHELSFEETYEVEAQAKEISDVLCEKVCSFLKENPYEKATRHKTIATEQSTPNAKELQRKADTRQKIITGAIFRKALEQCDWIDLTDTAELSKLANQFVYQLKQKHRQEQTYNHYHFENEQNHDRGMEL